MPGTRPSLRARVARLVESRPFQSAIIALIVINAIVLGIETYPAVMTRWGDLLQVINTVLVAVFVIEIVLRIFAHGPRFFRDGWSLFDLFVVVVALIPASAGSEVLRVLRLLRVLHLLSAIRSMRIVVSALGAAIPGILSIGGLLVMILYVFAVSSTTLFRDTAPEAFGDLLLSTASLFRVMIADGWSDIVAPMAAEESWVYAFFILYTVVTTFIVLNLFVAVTVEAMNRKRTEETEALVESVAETVEQAAQPGRDGVDAADTGSGDAPDAARADTDDRVLRELAALRSQLDRVEAQLAERSGR